MSCDTQSDELIWPRGNVDFMEFTVTAADELTTQPVEITFDRTNFIACAWGGVGSWNAANTIFTRNCKTSQVITDDDFPPGEQTVQVFARVTETPAVPLIPAGTIVFI